MIFLDLPSENATVQTIRVLASKVLFALSMNFYNSIFNRICVKLQEMSTITEEMTDFSDIELIQHINLDFTGLKTLITGMLRFYNRNFLSNRFIRSKAVNDFKLLRKPIHLCLVAPIEGAIWNWMESYPHEFAEVQRKPNEALAAACNELFDCLEPFCESKKNKYAIWPLQMMLLVLSPVSFVCKKKYTVKLKNCKNYHYVSKMSFFTFYLTH